MRYYLGPWQWVTTSGESQYQAPTGAVGAIDLGTLPEMAKAGVPRKGCLCWTSGAVLPSEYALLGEGDVREITRSGRLTSAMQSGMGYAPRGDRLHEMILDCLIGGADPEGLSAPMPIMPGTDGWMDLWLVGHGRVKGERFEWGRTPHTSKVKALLRQQFAQLMLDAQDGRLNDAVHHRRVLDAWCEKYRVTAWQEFVPDALQKDVPGRVPHATTVTESFNKADSTTLGPDLSWTEVENNLQVLSNACSVVTLNARCEARADSDLSSADNYAQVVAVALDLTGSAARQLSAAARYSASAETAYIMQALINNGGAGVHQKQMQKSVAAVRTALGGPTTYTPAVPYTIKCEANGSTINGYIDGVEQFSATDTAITGHLRGGIVMRSDAATAVSASADSYQGGDIAAAGILYTQLERSVRGLNRGTYTQVES